MSQIVRTYARGTRVRIVPDEVAEPWRGMHRGAIGTVVGTADAGDGWTIWVEWDSDRLQPEDYVRLTPEQIASRTAAAPPQFGYTFDQLEAIPVD